MRNMAGKPMALVITACGFALPASFGASALAVQRLVAPGQEWQTLAPDIKPGDQIILMPGRHRPAVFESLVGQPGRPITIRSADPANPSEIQAEQEGLRINRAAHLVVKDLNINQATVNGICLGEPGDSPEPGHVSSNIQLRNIGVFRTGPRGQRHGLLIARSSEVHIENCRIEGWGGSGIELVACRDVTVRRCRLKGLDDHGQINGIRVRAASQRVQIEQCRLEDAGQCALSAGGLSDLREFQPPITSSAASGSACEASQVQMENCTIVGGQIAIAFINANDCLARNNTIVRPRRCVMALLDQHDDPRISPGRRNVSA